MKTDFLKSLCKPYKQSDHENKALTDVDKSEENKIEEPLKNLTAEKWLWLLNYYGEAKLSMDLYGTINNYFYDLPDHLQKRITNPSELTDEQKTSIIKFKKDFDGNWEKFYGQVSSELGINGISVWSPVFRYLINQVPDTYMLNGDQLFAEFFSIYISDGNYHATKSYIATCVPDDTRIFESNKKRSFSFLENLIPGKQTEQEETIISRDEKINILLPNRKTTSEIIKKEHKTVCLSFFSNETSGITRFSSLWNNKMGATPSYIGLGKNLSISIQQKDKIETIVEKEEEGDPIMFFEKRDMTVIPFDGLDNHPIFKYIMENVKIEDLDITKIISDSLKNDDNDQKSL